MFLTDDELKSALKDVLARAAGETLRPYWDSVVSAANTTAYWEIVSVFLRRGFSKKQVDQWDRGREFQRAIGLWFALEQLAAMQPDQYGKVPLAKLDRRQELETVPLTVGGDWSEPETNRGQIVTGPFDDRGDLFVPFDPGDPRLGQPARF